MTLTRSQKKFLRDLFPGKDFLTSTEETLVFGADSSRGFAPPWAVVRPKTLEQVVSLLSWAHQERIPIIPRSRGTNMVGGCVPDSGGVVVSMLDMDRIVEISASDFIAVVEPGVVTARLQKEAAEKSLFYPPDPASGKFSTIGGNVMTNAGGMRAVKYGVTRDYVLGLEAVLPGGEVIRTGGRCHKNVVGLDLTRLLVGSEGTLALVTRVTLKLLPLPQATASILVAYETLDKALAGSEAVFRAGILPVAMELMTREVLAAVSELAPAQWPEKTGAVLLLKQDGSQEELLEEQKRLDMVLAGTKPLFRRSGSGAREEELWEIRRLISPASFRVRPDKMSEDITVPRGRVGELIRGIRVIAGESGLPILTFGHLGDGNIHTNIMYDRLQAEEATRASAAKERIMDLVLSLEGTLSGEHGIGLIKQRWAGKQLGSAQTEIMHRIKTVFDPHAIMNPGKGF
ncbi:MAG: FAD-binding oxidoreductase [Desulfovibrionales bacterium]